MWSARSKIGARTSERARHKLPIARPSSRIRILRAFFERLISRLSNTHTHSLSHPLAILKTSLLLLLLLLLLKPFLLLACLEVLDMGKTEEEPTFLTANDSVLASRPIKPSSPGLKSLSSPSPSTAASSPTTALSSGPVATISKQDSSVYSTFSATWRLPTHWPFPKFWSKFLTGRVTPS